MKIEDHGGVVSGQMSPSLSPLRLGLYHGQIGSDFQETTRRQLTDKSREAGVKRLLCPEIDLLLPTA
jgi:hypothetical protein